MYLRSCRPADTNCSYTAWLRPELQQGVAFLVVGDGYSEF